MAESFGMQLAEYFNNKHKEEKMREKLTVQIPKRYRKSLERRWKIDNFDLIYGDYEKYQPCVLCQVHYTDRCNNCPLARFEKYKRYDHKVGCFEWLRKIKATTLHSVLEIGMSTIGFPEGKVGIRQLKRIVDIASRYIEWV